ncbi:glycosyltransferase family 39 protein, partial [Crossiella equi]|uniref:glycosyltransferase family 39 protein n=1 Tax=Crossiella equi TaxID=130796 RepID=UPI000A38C7D6
ASTAAAAAVLAGRWFGVRAAWCAGVLFALVPMVSRMAQEARPYGFVLLFTALATLALVHALDRPAWGRWGLYALALAAVGLTQLTGLALVAGHAVLVLLARGPGRWPFLPAAAASVLPSVPLAVISLGGSQGVVGFIPRPGFLDLLGVSAVVPPGSALWPQLLRSTTMAWVLLALALAALAVGPRRRVAGALAAFAGPVVAIWAASQAGPSFFFARYLVFLLPLLAVAAGVTVAALRLPAVIAAVLVVVAGASVPDQLATRAVASHEAAFYPYEMFSEHPGQYADYRGLAALLRQAQDGDAVVYSDRGNFWFTDTGVDYHLRGAGPRDVFLDRTPAQANALGAVEGTDHAARLADVRRVWVP